MHTKKIKYRGIEYNYLTLKDEKSISSTFNRIVDYFEKNTYLNE